MKENYALKWISSRSYIDNQADVALTFLLNDVRNQVVLLSN